VFVDVISVSVVLYVINFANCYQYGPKKARKEAKEQKVNKAITIEKKKEIVQKCGVSGKLRTLYNYFVL
jgi:hypothetical protein